MKIDFRGSTKNPLDNSSGILYNYYIVFDLASTTKCRDEEEYFPALALQRGSGRCELPAIRKEGSL